MDYEEIVFFERLGFGWVVDDGVVAKVFPYRMGKKRPLDPPDRVDLNRTKRVPR